jgi:signal transduction histidine kinase
LSSLKDLTASLVGFNGKIFLVALLSSLLGAALVYLVGRELARDAVGQIIGSSVRDRVAIEQARCLKSPATWFADDGANNRTYAYNEQLVSENPEAPLLDPRLAMEARSSPSRLTTSSYWLERGGHFVIAVSDTGPCAFGAGSWRLPASAKLWASALLFPPLLGIVSTLLAYAIALRPLTRRIHLLRMRAEHMGTLSSIALPQPNRDELSLVEEAMQAADARIVADARRLEARRHALERHLEDIAHDLKTPLASLTLTLEELARQPLAADPARYVDAALLDALYVTHLSNNLRLASRLAEGWDPRGSGEQANLNEVVTRTAERLKFVAERRRCLLNYAVPDSAVLVECKHLALERVVGNLVDNAVAYGNIGGHVAVTLSCPTPDTFELSIVDDGPGVAPAQLPRLMTASFRSDAARARDSSDTGLGLAIVGEICRRSALAFRITSNEPCGLRCTVAGQRSNRPAHPGPRFPQTTSPSE